MKSEAKLYAVMGAIVALGGGFLVFNKDSGQDPAAATQPTPTPPPVTEASFSDLEKGTRHFKGSPTARYTVIEFADLECPSCRSTHEMVLKKFGKEISDVRLGYRHFPLDNIHQFASPAAIATEFADKQGKFWEVYETILEKPKEELSQDIIDAAVKKAGLDMAEYEKVKKDPELLKKVTADRDAGIAAGVAETPTFFLRDNQTKTTKMVTGWRNLYPELKGGIAGLPTPVPANNPPGLPSK
jgi:protein-disulfide isomerase